MRTALAQHARSFPDPLPAELELPLRRDALAALHFPVDRGAGGGGAPAARARRARRAAARRRALRDDDAVAPSLAQPGELIDRYRDVLPFELTEHQERAITEIDLDLAQTTPMQRLLQGDVGSGKTVVALYALLRAVENRAARAR